MKRDPKEEARLVEAVVSAHRPEGPDGTLAFAPAWHDLDAASRALAYDETLRARALEAALDPEGLTSTARAILARLRGRP